MSPDEEEKSEGDASEAQDAPVTEAAAVAKQPSAEAEQPSAGAGAPVADAEQPGTKTPAEQPSAGAEQSATRSAPTSAAEPPAAGAPVAEAEQPGTKTPAEQPSAGAEQSATRSAPTSAAEPPAAGAPVAEAKQPGTKTPAEQPSAGAEQSATTSAPASAPAEPRAAAAPVARPPAPPGRSAGPAPRSDRRGSGPPERGGRYFGRRKVCTFCVDKAKSVDYKDASKLRRFVSDRGRIEGRRRTGVCAKHQRWLAVALKRARHLALLPYTPEHIRSSGSFPSRR